ncbi:MAG: hypothetical protein Q9182_005880 [Xanthomendoza sp. 2 TL-2023]
MAPKVRGRKDLYSPRRTAPQHQHTLPPGILGKQLATRKSGKSVGLDDIVVELRLLRKEIAQGINIIRVKAQRAGGDKGAGQPTQGARA